MSAEAPDAARIIRLTEYGRVELAKTEHDHERLEGAADDLAGHVLNADQPHLVRILDHAERLYEELVCEAPGIAEQLGMWERFARHPHGSGEERASLLRTAEREVMRLLCRIRWHEDQLILLVSDLVALMERAEPPSGEAAA